jgi:hypothetical protein
MMRGQEAVDVDAAIHPMASIRQALTGWAEPATS